MYKKGGKREVVVFKKSRVAHPVTVAKNKKIKKNLSMGIFYWLGNSRQYTGRKKNPWQSGLSGARRWLSRRPCTPFPKNLRSPLHFPRNVSLRSSHQESLFSFAQLLACFQLFSFATESQEERSLRFEAAEPSASMQPWLGFTPSPRQSLIRYPLSY